MAATGAGLGDPRAQSFDVLSVSCGGLVTKSCLTLATLRTVARQAPLSMGFSRQEYWSVTGEQPSISFSRGSSRPRNRTRVLHCRQIAGSPEDLANVIIIVDINDSKVRHGSKFFHATVHLILTILCVIGTIVVAKSCLAL